MIKVTVQEKRALAIATALALLGGAYFLRFYFMLIAFAAILAFSFNGIYQRLLKRGYSSGKAASLTFVIALLVIIIPIALILAITTFQIVRLIESVQHIGYNVSLNNLLQDAVNWVNSTLTSLHISHQISVQDVTNALADGLKSFGDSFLQGLKSSLSSFIAFFSTAIIFIYVFLSLLKNQNKLLDTVHKLNPLGHSISQLYTERMAAMTKAMVRGQFIIATAQGFTDAALIYLAGIHQGFFFFGLLLTAFSIIPLGGGIIVIPMGIIMILLGNIVPGLILLGGHILIVTNIDNVLRPRLVPDEARLDPALTLLAVFSGLKFFGFLGIILGPVLMIVIVTTIQVYLDVYKDTEMRSGKSSKKRQRGIINTAKGWGQKLIRRGSGA